MNSFGYVFFLILLFPVMGVQAVLMVKKQYRIHGIVSLIFGGVLLLRALTTWFPPLAVAALLYIMAGLLSMKWLTSAQK